MLWCWRCRQEMPMLDEEEFKIIYKLYMDVIWSRHDRIGAELKVSEYYSQITGAPTMHPNVIMHHRIALYGPPCENCGKPYRTNQATFCAACGHKRVK